MTARIPLAVVAIGLAVVAVAPTAETAVAHGGARVPRLFQPWVPAAVPGKRQDVLFLGAERPVLIRFHIEIDGRPLHEAHREATERYLKALFRFLDRDNDDFLSEAEARHVPTPLVPLPGGDSDFVHVAHNFSALDANGDGKVSFAELAEFHQVFSGGGFVHTFHPGAPINSAALSERLFTLLDTDKDGRLSAQELAAAARVLARLDADEDDTVAAREVAPELFPTPVPGMQVATPPMPPAAAAPVSFLVPGEMRPSEMVYALFARYAPDQLPREAPRLSRKEFAVEADVFARLDKNGDGFLDRKELEAFADRPADVELKVRLGERARGTALLEVLRPSGKAPLASTVRRSGTGGVILQFGTARLELRCDHSHLGPHFFASLRQTWVRAFRTADANADGHLDRGEADRSPFFRDIFDALDRNGDGRIDEKEVLEYVDGVLAFQARALAAQSSLLISQPGAGLWDLLDTNRDGQLGLREVRVAPALLASLAGKDATLEPGGVPTAYQLVLGPGMASLNRLSGDVLVELSPTGRLVYPPATLGGGPLWFRKMDRNGDGDVSQREFLGTPEAFKKLDLDGDGLISRQEAEAAEALRTSKKKEASSPKR
jgi:Ca2+-binding EF-hand superfamily protein